MLQWCVGGLVFLEPHVPFHNTWDVSCKILQRSLDWYLRRRWWRQEACRFGKKHTSTTKRSSVTTCCIRCRMSFRVGFPEHGSGDERHDSIISISFIHPITTCGWRIHSVFPTLPIYIYMRYYNSSKKMSLYLCVHVRYTEYIYIHYGWQWPILNFTNIFWSGTWNLRPLGAARERACSGSRGDKGQDEPEGLRFNQQPGL